jgi:hypothetical protein
MKKTLLLFLTLLLLGAAVAQDKPQAPSDTAAPIGMYRLDFVIRELDGTKVVNSRNYSMLLEAPGPRSRTNADLRAGNRVPVNVGSKEASQVQYMDVGVTINASLSSRAGGAIVFGVSTEISSLALPEGAPANGMTYASSTPVVRSSRSSAEGILTPGKELVVSSIDDPVSNRKFVIAMLPTKLM